jgi:DNA-binding MarR family transcriptional regulator
VARLERLGLIERRLGLIERRLGPGRGVGLYVTDAGQEMAQVAATREEKLNAQLGKEHSEALTGLLRESRAILREAR